MFNMIVKSRHFLPLPPAMASIEKDNYSSLLPLDIAISLA